MPRPRRPGTLPSVRAASALPVLLLTSVLLVPSSCGGDEVAGAERRPEGAVASSPSTGPAPEGVDDAAEEGSGRGMAVPGDVAEAGFTPSSGSSLVQTAFDNQLGQMRLEPEGRGEGVLEERSIEIGTRGTGVGRMLPDLGLEDLSGEPVEASELAEAEATVVLVRDTGCPVSRRYGPVVARLEERFADEPVVFLHLYQGSHEDEEGVRADMRRYGCEGRAILDEEGAFGRAFDVRTTTEAFVFDSARTLVYRGAVDDRVGRGVTRDQADEEFVADAVEALLEGRPLDVRATTAPGCLLAFDEPADEAATDVTYHGDVSRIVQRKCLPCHRDGGAAPFPLRTWEDLHGRRAMIEFVVENRIMPPWFAEPGSGPWRNDRSLTAEESETLLAWIEAGCPEGDPENAPLPRRFPGPGEWSIGEPDRIVRIPEPVTVPPEGFLEYQKFLTEPAEEGRWISKIEILPTAPEVVHHVSTHFRVPGGKSRVLQGYIPGQEPTEFPVDVALFLPKGARIFFSVHYNPIGVERTDQLAVGLVYAEEPPALEVLRVAVNERDFAIPPQHPNWPVTSELEIDRPLLLSHLMPHMHLRGRSFRVEALLPGGERRELLHLPEWDFDWQLTYELAEPFPLPGGTRIRFTGRFDNSADNPSNPNPAQRVTYGRWTHKEMMMLGFEFLVDGPGG